MIMHTLDTLSFDNSYTELPSHFYQRVMPTPLKSPFLISLNTEVAKWLSLDPCSLTPERLAEVFGGHAVLPGSDPIAMKYTGHQFGVYNPDLGDGRGLLLGEVINDQGQRLDLHLKGAGKTPFSRFADGRAVLRSSIREYLVSEAMHGLGIPTTRALCLVGSEELAMRDGRMEPCATVLRVTPCHIRFGHFEYFYYSRRHDDLKVLADYCLERYFPDCLQQDNPYLAMFKEVTARTAKLVAQWQGYGFVHAVLNTDNMSLIGESFDYGPYSFMDHYKPDTISNQNDHKGRYAFAQQPAVVQWNLACLAQTLLTLVDKDALVAVLDSYPAQYEQAFLDLMRKRLGLLTAEESDSQLVEDLVQLFTQQAVDMNRFFRRLNAFDGSETSLTKLMELLQHPAALNDWLLRYEQRLTRQPQSHAERAEQMNRVNPEFILRNYMAQEAISAATEGDFRLVNDLLSLLRNPSEPNKQYAYYAESPPDWAGAICLTCSS
ncbi:protein adenylyltransferase SelO [Neptuniibacter sp. CAU 1671]|uniref:protein adenylyltransferase SelO n=1 Tax=Neptuniibacter sp. CAU 1671 TaxID=3032593 RepID=UPI0023DA37CA|nr:YdiU family protein [Neptuniibacter sp. CAU 1671]MDF2183114.1 YdiU family protein [Neptuniibacter sp. CAU 1671]